jgi:hypothetical protein
MTLYAPFSMIEGRVEMLPVPDTALGCKHCVRHRYPTKLDCGFLPACAGMTFALNTQETRANVAKALILGKVDR